MAALKATQFDYSDEDQIIGVLLEWQVSGNDPITVLASGAVVGTLAGTATSVVLTAGPEAAGVVTFTVEAGGSSSSDDIFTRTSQPFDDPLTTCQGGTRNPRGACDLILTIAAERKPSFYRAAVDGEILGDEEIPGASTEHAISGLVPGQRCVTLVGFLVETGNDYAGDFVETCCDFQCMDLPCDQPGLFSSCQHGFGPAAADNKVLVTWENGEPDYTEIQPVLDGKSLEPLPGDATSLELEGLAPGDHLLALQTACGERGMAEAAEFTLSVVSVAPGFEPARNISCRFTSPGATTLVVTWTTVDRPSEIEVYLVAPDDRRTKVRALPGGATSATIDGTTSNDRAGIRFVYVEDGRCFSSEVLVCTPSPPPAFQFSLADCDASASLDLTDSVFSLGFLFRGGAPPPCEAACDSNLDGRFDLADPVYTLNYLFLGGPPPQGKRPECDETKPGDTCSRSTCS